MALYPGYFRRSSPVCHLISKVTLDTFMKLSNANTSMRIARVSVLMLLAFSAICLVPNAHADTIVYESVSATLDGGSIDSLGVFGTQNANLSGQTITMTFSYDYTTLLAEATSATNGSNKSGPYTDGVEEGFNDYAEDGQEFASAKVGANIFSLSDSGSNSDQTWTCNMPNCGGSSPSYFYQSIYNNTNNNSQYEIESFLRGNLAPADLGTVSDMNNYFNNLTGTGYIFLNNGTANSEILSFADVTLLASSETPEPATWATLVFGLGAATFFGRRRNASR